MRRVQLAKCVYSAELTFRELHERLMLRNEQTKQVRLPEVYKEDDNAKANVSTWMNAQYIHEAVPHLLPVSLSHLTSIG